MGSPISSILAEIFIHNIEQTHILNTENNKHAHKIIYWYRYVDDILLMYKGSSRQIEQLHTHINKIHPKLKFTLETELNKSINFLDITITKLDNKHNFKIYRKPTTTVSVIHNTSNHPIQHKHAAFHSMIHRLTNIPMSTHDYNNELNTIKYIAQENGYPPEIINTILNKITHTNTKTQPQQSHNNKYITLTYHNSKTHKIASSFRKLKYNIAYKTNNTLKKHLSHKQTPTNKYTQTGIYKLTCNDCPCFYIGQTGRSFSTRFKEHTKALTQPYINSNYAEHLINNNHNYTNIETNMHILHTQRKSRTLNTTEQYEIYKHHINHPQYILNDQIHHRSHTLFDTIIQRSSHTPTTHPHTSRQNISRTANAEDAA